MDGSLGQFVARRKRGPAVGKRGWAVLFSCFIGVPLAAQEHLVYSIEIYSEKNAGSAFDLSSEKSWIPLAEISKQIFARIPEPAEGALRKWRARVQYSNFVTSQNAAIELQFEPLEGKPVSFVLPWRNSSVASLQNDSSNWFVPNEFAPSSLFRTDTICSVRLLTEPDSRTQASVELIMLEAWDIAVEQEPEMAAAGILPSLNREEDSKKTYIQDALQFSLDFVKYSLNGELAKYYYLQASTVYGLEDGKAYSVYRWPPPQKDYGDVDIDLYVKNYDYKIYSVEEMRELYPEWFYGRRWIPGDNSYLFVGNQVREKGDDFVQENLLFFVVEYREGRWQVAARSLNS